VTPHDLPYLVTFVACEIGVTQLIAWRRRTEDSLRKAHDELEVRVAERTPELAGFRRSSRLHRTTDGEGGISRVNCFAAATTIPGAAGNDGVLPFAFTSARRVAGNEAGVLLTAEIFQKFLR